MLDIVELSILSVCGFHAVAPATAEEDASESRAEHPESDDGSDEVEDAAERT